MTENQECSEPAPKKSRITKTTRLLICLVIVVGGLLIALYIQKTKPEARKKLPVKITPLVTVQKMFPDKRQMIVSAMGTVIPARETTLKSRIAGEVISVHPEFIDNITTVRSPQECLAVVVKTYFAKLKNIDPKNISVVSIMPCIAKKFESRRSGEDKSGAWDVDYVLTTREFIKMTKTEKIDLANIKPENFDADIRHSPDV